MAAERRDERRKGRRRAFAALLLALALVAQGAFAAARARDGLAFLGGADRVASAPAPCSDASAGGPHRSPCADREACCILCSAVCAGSAAEPASRPILPPRRPAVVAWARLLPLSVDHRPAGWVSSWSAQAPPSFS